MAGFALASSFAGAAAAALLVVGVGRLAGALHPGAAIWLWTGVVAGLGAATGIAVAQRAVATDSGTLLKRLAGAALLGGFAVTLVLLGFYGLPVLQPSVSPRFLSVVGPLAALLFFPVLLLAMTPRMAAAMAKDRPVSLVVVSILGAITGWGLVRTAEAPLPPLYAIALSAILVELIGLAAAWAASRRLLHRSATGLLVTVLAFAVFILAAELGRGGGMVAIGSV